MHHRCMTAWHRQLRLAARLAAVALAAALAGGLGIQRATAAEPGQALVLTLLGTAAMLAGGVLVLAAVDHIGRAVGARGNAGRDDR